MLGLIISVIAFILICFIFYLIGKNKEKLKKKFKIQNQEIMRCPKCSKEYEDLSLKLCNNCNTSLERKTKYNISKGFKRRLLCIAISLILIISVLIVSGICINNYIKEQKRLDKYNEDINLCYELIKEKSDWEEFKNVIDNHNQESNFEPEAFEKLYQAIDERIENIKSGKEDNKLLAMLDNIKEELSSNTTSNNILQKIDERYLIVNSYSNIKKSDEYIQEQKYKEAFNLLNTVISQNKDKNQEIVDIATNKQNEIKDKAFEQIINEAQIQINNQNYSLAQSILENYKDLGNQTILDMYNNATNEVNRIEAERKAKEEEEERKIKQAEIDAKKDKIIVDTNGKKIYKVYMTSNKFSISGTFKGEGHFSIKLLDDNQDFYDLLVNEIGDYVVNTSTDVVKGNYYYLQIECTRGTWNLNWNGTYGS